MSCVSHHLACNCREAAWRKAAETARLALLAVAAIANREREQPTGLTATAMFIITKAADEALDAPHPWVGCGCMAGAVCDNFERCWPSEPCDTCDHCGHLAACHSPVVHQSRPLDGVTPDELELHDGLGETAGEDGA